MNRITIILCNSLLLLLVIGCSGNKSNPENETDHNDSADFSAVHEIYNYDSLRSIIQPNFIAYPMEILELTNDCIYMFKAGNQKVSLHYNYDMDTSWILIGSKKTIIPGRILLDAIFHNHSKLIFSKVYADNEVIQSINIRTGEVQDLYNTSAVKKKNMGNRRTSEDLIFLDEDKAIYFREYPFIEIVTFGDTIIKKFDLSKIPDAQGDRNVSWVHGFDNNRVLVTTTSDQNYFQCDIKQSFISTSNGRQISKLEQTKLAVFEMKLIPRVYSRGLNLLYYYVHSLPSNIKNGYCLKNDTVISILCRHGDYTSFINCVDAETVYIPIDFYGRKPNYGVKQFEGIEAEALIRKAYDSEEIFQSDLNGLTERQIAIAGIVLLGKYGYSFPENFSAGIYLNSFDFYRFIVGNTSVGKEWGDYPSTSDLREVINRMSDKDVYNLLILNRYYSIL